MFCNACGSPNPDGSAFCSTCGKPIVAPQNVATPAPPPPPRPQPVQQQYAPPPVYPAPPPVQPPSYSAPQTPPPYYSPVGYSAPPTPYAASRPAQPRRESSSDWRSEYASYFRAAWREFASTPLVLTAIIVYCVSILMSLIDSSSAMSGLSGTLGMIGMGDLGDSMFGIMFLGSIPSILIGIGMWMLYADGKSYGGGYINTSGFSLIKGATIAQLVMISIAFLGVFISSCNALTELSKYSNRYASELESMVTVTLIVTLLIGIFAIALLVCQLRLIESSREAAQTSYPDATCVVAVAVICFISGGISLISMIAGGMLTFSGILSVGQSFLFGIVLLSYKTLMDELATKYYAMANQAKKAGQKPHVEPRVSNMVPAWKRVEQVKQENS